MTGECNLRYLGPCTGLYTGSAPLQPLEEIYAKLLVAAGFSPLITGSSNTKGTASSIVRSFTGSDPVPVADSHNVSYEMLVDTTSGTLTLTVIASWLRLALGKPPLWPLFEKLDETTFRRAVGPIATLLDPVYRGEPLFDTRSVEERILEPSNPLLSEAAAAAGVTVGEATRILRELGAKNIARLPYSWRIISTLEVSANMRLYIASYASLHRMPVVIISPAELQPPKLNYTRTKIDSVEARRLRRACRLALDELSMAAVIKSEDGVVVDAVSPWAWMSIHTSDREKLASRLASSPALHTLLHTLELIVDIGVKTDISMLVDACKLVYIAVEHGACAGLRGLDPEAVALDTISATLLAPLIIATARYIQLGTLNREQIHTVVQSLLEALDYRGLTTVAANELKRAADLEAKN